MTHEPSKFSRYLYKTSNGVAPLEIRSEIEADASILAKAFNEYFQSIFLRTSRPPEHDETLVHDSTMAPAEFSEQGILNLLLPTDVKKSPGPDNISNMFLRRYAGQVTPFIHEIFTASFKTASVPAEWLRAKIIPIHKGGKKLQVNNYRPISLTSCCCKHMEHNNKAIMTYLGKKCRSFA